MFGMWVIMRKEHGRTLICDHCGLIIDKINAAINIAKRGRTSFKQSKKWRNID